jgi:urate oxidase
MILTANRYGKARVRVLKILREGPIHTIKEIEIAVLLEGDFAASYTAADNRRVVATDTIKNTVHVLAKQHLGAEIERFGVVLGAHFLEQFPQVDRTSSEIVEKDWQRMSFAGEGHPHSFVAGSGAKAWTRVVCSRETQSIESGVQDLVILKSTGSGWEGFPRTEFTTLPETSDRILATSLKVGWLWSRAPENYRAANRAILDAMLEAFAKNYSPSAQASLFQMGSAALEVCPEISRVDLALPNRHCLLIDLSPFGMENQNELFVPIDEPHGQIEGTVTRA